MAAINSLKLEAIRNQYETLLGALDTQVAALHHDSTEAKAAGNDALAAACLAACAKLYEASHALEQSYLAALRGL